MTDKFQSGDIRRSRSNSLTSHLAEGVGAKALPTAPMQITATFNEEGLGLVKWWRSEEEGGGEQK